MKEVIIHFPNCSIRFFELTLTSPFPPLPDASKKEKQKWYLNFSSKEMGFYNPRSHLDRRIGPCSLKMGRTGKGEWLREGASLGEGWGENADPSRVYIE